MISLAVRGEVKESKANLFEKQETKEGLQQVLTLGEKDIKDEDIKEVIFYIDTNGESKMLQGPSTVQRERKGEYFYRLFLPFCIHFTGLYVTSRDEAGIVIYPPIQ